MAKIAFVQHSLLEKLGVMSMSSVLKRHGHECEVFCLAGEEDFYKSLFDFGPDIAAYSLSMGEQTEALEMLRKIKELDKDVKTFIGGPYVLVFPEVIKEACIDLMCIGDGEYACLEVMDRLDRNEELFDIPGIWVKSDGQIHESSDIAYVDDIKQLPILDRDLYCQRYSKIRNARTKPFIMSRGCPYKCSYCYTSWINQFYKDKCGVHFRLDSYEKVISEISYVREKYGLEWVRFHDGTLNANPKYIKEFLRIYSQHDLPGFIAYARVENIDEEFVSLLSQAGCDKIVLGIQSGDEKIRTELANRRMTNEQIINACDLLKKYKIRIGVDVMFGWPGESMDSAYKTIKLCRRIGPDDVNSNVLVPYSGTRIAEYCMENHYIDRMDGYADAGSTRTGECLRIKQDNIKQLINLDKLCYLAVRFPRLEWLINLLIKLPPNRLFVLIKDLQGIRRDFKFEIKGFKKRCDYLGNYLRRLIKPKKSAAAGAV